MVCSSGSVWLQQGQEPLREREAIMHLMNLLSCALGPLSRKDVKNIAGPPLDQGYRLNQVIQTIGRFVLGDGKNQGYVFSHPQLGYYFLDEILPKVGHHGSKGSTSHSFVQVVDPLVTVTQCGLNNSYVISIKRY